MLSASEARNKILSFARPLGTTTLSLERCLGLVPAADVVADENVPSFDNAGMDGFAVKTSDLSSVPIELKLAGEIAAGSGGTDPLQQGEAIRIMTGAKVPPGADAVIQQEWTKDSRPGYVEIEKAVQNGHNVRKAGADLAKGAVAVSSGIKIRPQEIGTLASLGKQFIEVYRPPSVSILGTGNELVEVDKKVAPGKIRDSNTHQLSALVRETGAEAVNLGIARDEHDDLASKIRQGLRSDILVTSGGVSVGKYDLVMQTMKELGVEIIFWKVNIKPGMPLLFGRRGGTLVFGLPGNPVSSMVTFIQFVRPAVYRMMGMSALGELRMKARLQHELSKSDGKRHFIRGVLEQKNGTLTVRSTGSQISNILSSLVKANCLIILEESVEHASAGDEVEVELL